MTVRGMDPAAMPPDAFLDHGDGPLVDDDGLPDEEADLFVLFAEALDPASPKTVETARAEWAELFGDRR